MPELPRDVLLTRGFPPGAKRVSAFGLRIDELRKAMTLTQQQMAETLQMSQAAVSKIERQTDMYVSTLRRFVAAMGEEDLTADYTDDADKKLESRLGSDRMIAPSRNEG
jgi:transcriptional regulator with XRE-family HTH domain